MAELPRGTVSLLFTDVEASTELVRTAGDRYAAALEDQRRLLRSAVAEAGGREIDCRGEEFFFAFTRANDAVTAAVAGQRKLAAHEWPDGVRLKVRMGIHTGEPSVRDDGYLGLDVHRAARICSLGHGGQVLLSQTTRDLLSPSEVPGAVLKDLGAHQLKGLPTPELIFQVVGDGLPSEFPPLRDRGEPIPSVAADRSHRLRERLAHLMRREPDRSSLEATGWRVRELLPTAPEPLQRDLAELGGDLFSAGRELADVDRYLANVDRAALARRLAEYREMAVTSRRARREADSITNQVSFVDRLAELRRGVNEGAGALATRVEGLRTRLRSASPSDLSGEIEDLRRRVHDMTTELDRTLSEARAAVGMSTQKPRRTRHRGIYRRGTRYLVPYFDELGVEAHREFETLEEAREFRAGVRLARERKRDFGDPPRVGTRDRRGPW